MIFKNIRIKLYYWRLNNYRNRLLKRVLGFLKDSKRNNELNEVYKYLEQNGLSIFPYNWTRNYNNLKFHVFSEDDFHYVLHKGNKFFFKKGWSDLKVSSYYRNLLMEQDPQSPHLYCEDNFKVAKDEVLLDIGVAEGSFSMDNIEVAKEIYIFEKDEDWMKALERSFAPFSNKVKLINKYVGAKNSDSVLTLDSLTELRGQKLFIKIDVDGAEREVLKGMKELLKACTSVKIALCTYHRQEDFLEFQRFFINLDYSVINSKGFMLFFHDKAISEPYLRRGVLRATKK